MNITLEKVKRALREEDIESLIEFGTPDDEYDHEAKEIYSAIRKLPENDINNANIAVIAAIVWEKWFNRSPEEIAERMPAFENVALKLLQP